MTHKSYFVFPYKKESKAWLTTANKEETEAASIQHDCEWVIPLENKSVDKYDFNGASSCKQLGHGLC